LSGFNGLEAGMATTKFRLGLVGAGRMGRTHLRALAGSERVEVAAVAEPSAANRALLSLPARRLHPDVDALLAAGGLDGVLIAAPSPLHVGVVERIAAAGLPILCEKPCGVSAAEARQAAALAEQAGVRLQVAYWRRFVPELRRLKERIAAGELGALYFVACFQWDETPPAATFRAASGGPFIDMGVHEFDQLRWLTGQEPGNFRVARSKTTFDANVPEDPDAVQALCDLSGGASGLVSLGRRFPVGDACWAQAFGTRGFEDCRFLWPPAGEQVFLAALRRQAEDFADAVRGKPSEGATAADAVAALSAAEQAMANG
jgi:myo-inositol 2-dehydrogenase/D-chiro-inositol 1-dehydrogenase